LLLAWRTCASKADAAVSEEIYHLLVSILPSLPNLHAISLVRAVEDTLNAAKGSSLFEVAEFCGALATSANMDAKAGQLGVHYFRSEFVVPQHPYPHKIPLTTVFHLTYSYVVPPTMPQGIIACALVPFA
jgi:hypothetical protein